MTVVASSKTIRSVLAVKIMALSEFVGGKWKGSAGAGGCASSCDVAFLQQNALHTHNAWFWQSCYCGFAEYLRPFTWRKSQPGLVILSLPTVLLVVGKGQPLFVLLGVSKSVLLLLPRSFAVEFHVLTTDVVMVLVCIICWLGLCLCFLFFQLMPSNCGRRNLVENTLPASKMEMNRMSMVKILRMKGITMGMVMFDEFSGKKEKEENDEDDNA